MKPGAGGGGCVFWAGTVFRFLALLEAKPQPRGMQTHFRASLSQKYLGR